MSQKYRIFLLSISFDFSNYKTERGRQEEKGLINPVPDNSGIKKTKDTFQKGTPNATDIGPELFCGTGKYTFENEFLGKEKNERKSLKESFMNGPQKLKLIDQKNS